MPQIAPAIIGYRQDRIGARLIAMLNVQRFAALTGTEGRFCWLSQPDGPYPELADPTRFFSAGYVARHLRIVSAAPDLTGRGFYPALSKGLNLGGLRAALRDGQGFWTDSNLSVDRVMDEDTASVARQMADLSAAIDLAPALRSALGGARAALARRWGPGRPFAIHVRRGDILDALPWSLSSWPTKYLPDEFFRAFVAQVDGPVIAFSDTPDAVRHLAQGDARIVPVGDLVDLGTLDRAEVDLAEMLLMAGCRLIGAPAQSAFSRAAEVMGAAEVAPLPAALPEPARHAAFDALLTRVIDRPDSFFAPGDLAQSVQYAASHAVSAGRVPALLDLFAQRPEMPDRFPFLYRALAVAAQGAGMAGRAAELAAQGLAHPQMRRRDRSECEQVLTLTRALALPGAAALAGGPDPAAAPARPTAADSPEADFLNQLFRGRAQDSAVMPHLGWQVVMAGGMAARALMLAPELAALMAAAPATHGASPDTPKSDTPKPDTHEPDASPPDMPAAGTPGADPPPSLPVWVLLTDWEELLDNDAHRNALRGSPDLWGKIRPLGPQAAALEQAIVAGDPPPDWPPPDWPPSDWPGPDGNGADMLRRMGFLAAVLRLNGRFRRAYAVLHWLEDTAPAHEVALTAKRLADCAFRSGNDALGKGFMDRALAAAPDNVLLHLSAATRAAQAGQVVRMRRHLAEAQTILPDSALVTRKSRRIRRLLPPA
ncbi:hypothetical protein [Paracoccus jiaweipingae]|uniref:hypothetical protein n=1 Tax=unclassified Paracoccus (in: a-proteobacteria) TaxID=2688777 RepID=UPI0037911C0E